MLAGVVSAVPGGWNAPTTSFTNSVNFISVNRDDTEISQIGRVLWIGDPSLLPMDPMLSESGISYAISDPGVVDARARWQAGPVGPNDGVGLQLDLARSGDVVRLGRLLAPYGIDLIVVVNQLAPRPYEGPTVAAGSGVEQALAQQLDLERLSGAPDIVMFENTSGGGLAPLLPPSEIAARTPSDQLNVDLSQGSTELVNVRPGEWRLQAPPNSQTHLALDRFGLEAVSPDGAEISPGFDDLAVVTGLDVESDVTILYSERWPRRFGLILQVLLVGFGALMAQTRREEDLL